VITPPAGSVVRVTNCQLASGPYDWPFARTHDADIDAYWQRRKAETPGFFNGRIHLLSSYDIAGGTFRGCCFETDFKSFLYWRDNRSRDTTVYDAFGSALLRSAEGYVILGRQGPGNINSGLSYLPGGFIDPRDVAPGGEIDIDASILREVAEETGLDPAALTRQPGYLVTRTGQQISIAAEYVSPLPAASLVAQIRAHLSRDADPELEDAVVVRTAADIGTLAMPVYARILLDHLFA
jgi:8-oxo-dGTP pyrophosphatase MutT (NUDIX family)